jgi:hypothetical protein
MLAAAWALLFAEHSLVFRPWYMHWGASQVETSSVLPGDEIVPQAARQETRAITINAPAERIWPWLTQLGRDRSGFYSFDLLENLAGCRMPSIDQLRPDLQSWHAGDKLWMYPPDKAGGIGYATLRVFLPGQAMGFGTRQIGTPISAPENGSWSFVLIPSGANSTHLLVRGRAAATAVPATAFDRLVFESAHFVMERRMMLGIKQLVETGDRGRQWNNVYVLMFFLAFIFWLLASVRVVRTPEWRWPFAAVLVSGVAFQIVTLVQPPLAVSALLLVGTGAFLSRADRLTL